MFETVAVEELVSTLAGHDFTTARSGTFDQQMGSERVDAIVAAERLRRHAEAVLAEHTAALVADRRSCLNSDPDPSQWVDEGDLMRSVFTEVALARQLSVGGAQTQVVFARVLADLPKTAAALADGSISYRVAKAVTDECITLSAAGRGRVDDALAADLVTLTAKRAHEAARRLVIAMDPAAADHFARAARAHRGVRVTAAPDAMGTLTATLTADQAWACFTALDNQARGLKAAGDARTINQLMADTLVERVLGITRADDVAVEIQLLMRPETMFGDEDTPALLAGYGPIPPGMARQMSAQTKTFIRRLFTRPGADGGNLDATDEGVIGRDPRRRRFDGALGDLIRSIDQHCQMPWCDNHIDDIDHRVPYAQGGTTMRADGDSYCRTSHMAKHLPGFTVRRDHPDSALTWTTPTGHSYTSRRPATGPRVPHRHPPRTPRRIHHGTPTPTPYRRPQQRPPPPIGELRRGGCSVVRAERRRGRGRPSRCRRRPDQ